MRTTAGDELLVPRQAPLAVVEVVLEPDPHVAAIATATAARTNCMRPIPATDQLQPGGKPRTQSTRFSTDASSRRGPPARSRRGPEANRSLLGQALRVREVPRFEDLELRRDPELVELRRDPTHDRKVFSKMSSPKFTVPQVSVAISGRSASGAARSAGVIPIAPPVENCTNEIARAADRVVGLPEALDVVGVRPVVVAAVHVHDARPRRSNSARRLAELRRRDRQIRCLLRHDFGPDRRHGYDQRIHELPFASHDRRPGAAETQPAGSLFLRFCFDETGSSSTALRRAAASATVQRGGGTFRRRRDRSGGALLLIEPSACRMRPCTE